MKIYCSNSISDIEEFIGTDFWVRYVEHLLGTDYYSYINIIDADATRVYWRWLTDEYLSITHQYGDPIDEVMNSDPVGVFLQRFIPVQPIELYTTEDMEDILGTKLTHIEKWERK